MQAWRNMVDKLLGARRDDDDGAGRGDTAAADLVRDSSMAQRHCSWHLSRIARAFRTTVPAAMLEVSRAAAVVTHTHNKCELAEVRYNEDRNNVHVGWRDHMMADMGAEPQAVCDEYERLLAAAPKPQWRRG